MWLRYLNQVFPYIYDDDDNTGKIFRCRFYKTENFIIITIIVTLYTGEYDHNVTYKHKLCVSLLSLCASARPTMPSCLINFKIFI